MKNGYIWSIINICGTSFFKNTIGRVCELVNPQGINELRHTKNTVQYWNPIETVETRLFCVILKKWK